MKIFNKFKLSIWQLLALGYFVIILVGSLLLTLPFATKQGCTTSYINALFTATSATCVTGLVPYDTNTHWTTFGQIVIICLIQLGGLGFMTFVSIVYLIVKRKWGVYTRTALIKSAGELSYGGAKHLISRILIGTLLFEGLGAYLFSIRFIQDFGEAKGIYYAIWHSISAFCNAGFDLMGGVMGSEFCSLSHYATDPLVSLTVCGLIIFGGLGFFVWGDIINCKFNAKKFQLHTKIVLIATGVLLIVSTLLILTFEYNSISLAGYNFKEKLLICFFYAVSPRTAGFTTVDFGLLTHSSYLLVIGLMFVGGSSGSTAGGVKVNTMAVIFMGTVSVFKDMKDINIGKRRVDYSILSQALAMFFACIFCIIFSMILICAFQPDLSVTDVAFEVVSALATVGLSLSLTPKLCVLSKIVIIILMYLGRVGILTFALAFNKGKKVADVRRPIEEVLIG